MTVVGRARAGILKPILMGGGADVPMLVILIGSLAGMVLSMIPVLFAGAVVLALMYTLYPAWLDNENPESEATS